MGTILDHAGPTAKMDTTIGTVVVRAVIETGIEATTGMIGATPTTTTASEMGPGIGAAGKLLFLVDDDMGSTLWLIRGSTSEM